MTSDGVFVVDDLLCVIVVVAFAAVTFVVTLVLDSGAFVPVVMFVGVVVPTSSIRVCGHCCRCDVCNYRVY